MFDNDKRGVVVDRLLSELHKEETNKKEQLINKSKWNSVEESNQLTDLVVYKLVLKVRYQQRVG